MEKVIIGRIICSYKVEGAFKISSSTSFPYERFKVGKKISLEDGKVLTISDVSFNNEIIIIKTDEINVKEEADQLKGKFLYATKDPSLLEKGQYYYSDIVGCKVVNQNNIDIGIVSKVEEFPAQLTLRIKGNKKEDILIPYIKEFIKSVDIDNKIIKVETIEGMI